jgi:hypothetical protein
LANVVAIAAGGYQSIALLGAGVSAAPMQITNVQAVNGVFSMAVLTARGKYHYLQYKDDLDNLWWTPGLPVPGDGTLKTFTDATDSAPRRVFRVWRKP